MSPTILPYRGVWPKIGKRVYIAPTAAVVGRVEICEDANIWFGCSVRADDNTVFIGVGANVQDGTVIHTDGGADGIATHIGNHVTIGHLALLHGCHLEDRTFIGMQATVMDGAVVESDAMVAAGALVTQGKRVPAGELWAGRPAKKMRDLAPEEITRLNGYAPHYVELAGDYLDAAD